MQRCERCNHWQASTDPWCENCHSTALHYEPSQAEIAAGLEEIQARWSAREEQKHQSMPEPPYEMPSYRTSGRRRAKWRSEIE